MRKLYETAVLAILLSVLSSPVIADVEDCPCWDEEFLAEITIGSFPDACGENTITLEIDKSLVSASHDIAIFDNFSLQLMAGTPFPGLPESCSAKLLGLPEIFFKTSEDQTEDCTALLRGLRDLFSVTDFDCVGW